MTTLLQIDDLRATRTGAARPLLDRFSLTLQAGETVALLGDAESGKDVVLRLLDGLAERGEDLSGTIRFGEGEARQAARKPRPTFRVTYLPGAASKPLNPNVSAVAQLSRVVARKLNCPRGAAREDLRNALSRLAGAPSFELLDCPPVRLDAVSMSWALLAAACAATPDLLLCDHPLLDISPASARALTEALLAEQKRIGFAILYAARGPQSVLRLGARTLVLRQGRVVEENDAAHLVGGQTHAYTQALFKALPQIAPDKPMRTATRGEPLLQVQGLGLNTLPKKAVRPRDAISFELRRGASLALVGEDGSGRRALMRAVLGLERKPGRILFDAVDLNLLSEAMTARLRRRVAFVTSDDGALDPRMTLWDTVDEPLRAHLQLSRDLTAGYREAALKRVGLASYDGRRPIATLSPFDRRRLLVARAIVGAPLLVVVDEPLRGLDAVAQTTMRDLLVDFRVEQQSAFLVITSDFAVAQALADEAMVFDGGRVVERGPIRNLLANPKESATKALVEAAAIRPLSQGTEPV
jgi:ABC-type microcin C transport system duplicated ATPase subunit YejF